MLVPSIVLNLEMNSSNDIHNENPFTIYRPLLCILFTAIVVAFHRIGDFSIIFVRNATLLIYIRAIFMPSKQSTQSGKKKNSHREVTIITQIHSR